jgi:5-methylcytosine-specific restriction endonuclease McrA
MSNYSDKLKDPRWQKKRLEILSRDNFTCKCCGDNESTLHVHHLIYSSGNPWEAPDNTLETLCASCHEWREEFNRNFGRTKHSTEFAVSLMESLKNMLNAKPNGKIQSHFSREFYLEMFQVPKDQI